MCERDGVRADRSRCRSAWRCPLSPAWSGGRRQNFARPVLGVALRRRGPGGDGSAPGGERFRLDIAREGRVDSGGIGDSAAARAAAPAASCRSRRVNRATAARQPRRGRCGVSADRSCVGRASAIGDCTARNHAIAGRAAGRDRGRVPTATARAAVSAATARPAICSRAACHSVLAAACRARRVRHAA